MKKTNNGFCYEENNRLICFEYSILFRLVEVHSLYRTEFSVVFHFPLKGLQQGCILPIGCSVLLP